MNDDIKPTPGMIAEARNFDGIYTGMCKPEEYEALIRAGLLRLSYEGPGGFSGLSKLRFTAP
jgi:hypothetical protein